MSYIHVTCLRAWLDGSKHVEDHNYVTKYVWFNIKCELCKNTLD
jgi:hypothetical protein